MTGADRESDDDIGTPQERQRILRALREWADSHPDQNMPIYFGEIDIKLTPGEIICHIEDETAIGVAILDALVLKSQELKEMTRSEITKFLGRQFPLTNFKEEEEDEE